VVIKAEPPSALAATQAPPSAWLVSVAEVLFKASAVLGVESQANTPQTAPAEKTANRPARTVERFT
jgi:hypothetical protein